MSGHHSGLLKRYSFAWVTLVLFLASLIFHFVFQVAEVTQEQVSHGEPFRWTVFWPIFLRSVFENWQSEFLQLVWQAAGLAWLYFWGSSQSKESDERLEAKVDFLIRQTGQDPRKFDLR